MQYLLLVYSRESDWTDTEREACYVESTELAHALHKVGKFIATNPLQSVDMAKSVRVRDGKRIVTDGPFAETREQLGGYFLIDAANLDEAVAIAERIPSVHKGTIEIRPVLDIDGLPAS